MRVGNAVRSPFAWLTQLVQPVLAPRSSDDVLSGDIMEWLSVYARDQATMALVATAFPGSIEEESAPLEAFDTVENEQDRADS